MKEQPTTEDFIYRIFCYCLIKDLLTKHVFKFDVRQMNKSSYKNMLNVLLVDVIFFLVIHNIFTGYENIY